MIVPKGTGTLTQQRMAQLHPTAAKWTLLEFDQRENEIHPIDLSDRASLLPGSRTRSTKPRYSSALPRRLRVYAKFCRKQKLWLCRRRRFRSAAMALSLARRESLTIHEPLRANRKLFLALGVKSAFSSRRMKPNLAIWCV
jgi:hypothetical protein